MIFRSLKLFVAAVLASVVLFGCGAGSSAPAPTSLVATASESAVTVSWDMTPGVEYLLFYGPTSSVPSSVTSMSAWIGLPGGGTQINAKSPFVVTGLVNGTSYSFSVNGRTNGGPGGPGATPVAATPRLAGSTWAAGAVGSAGTNDLNCVTFGASFVAGGVFGAMYSSADGVAWSPISYATTANLTANVNGCSYSGTYKLVGDGGLVLTSPDAVTWTPQTSGTLENLKAIASNNVNLTVAVGANGTIITSPDGITWTSRVSGTTNPLYAVNYSALNSGTWIAVGAAGTVLKSADGLTWTPVSSGTTADLLGIAYGASTAATGASIFVAVGTSGTVLTSAFGSTWSAVSTPVTTVDVNLKAVTYGTQFVAVGTGGHSFVSTDGVAWTPSSSPGTTSDLNAVVRGPLTYSAVGVGGANVLAR